MGFWVWGFKNCIVAMNAVKSGEATTGHDDQYNAEDMTREFENALIGLSQFNAQGACTLPNRTR